MKKLDTYVRIILELTGNLLVIVLRNDIDVSRIVAISPKRLCGILHLKT